MKAMICLKYLSGFIAVPLFSFTVGNALAFQDLDEPDDSLEQAHLILVGDKTRHQHTLHNRADEDWFTFYAMAKINYKIEVRSVGTDIDVVVELYDSKGKPLLTEPQNEGIEGEAEFLPWQAPSEAFYYLKISDIAPESDNCRTNIQYELQVARGIAPEFEGVIEGVVTDALSGQVITHATLFRQCFKNQVVPSFGDGKYSLSTCAGFSELNAKAEGYKSLTCQISVPQKFTIIRNMPLLPEGTLPPAPIPSQTVYHHGDTLRIEFQTLGLPPQSCIRYYFGIAYPDGRFFIMPDFNRLEPFNPPYLPHWVGTGNVVLDKPIDNDMPSGDYILYLLRMPEGIDDPVNNLDKGELNVGQFRVE